MVARERFDESSAKPRSSKRIDNIIDACLDQNLFGPWFKDMATWVAWFAFLRTIFGLPLNKKHLLIYQRCTHRTKPPDKPFKEGWLVVGRRGGKSLVLALIAVFIACFFDWTPYLAPGERATVVVIATDRRQARIILRYIEAFLRGIPLLWNMVETCRAESFDLEGQVTIEVHTANFRGVRGYTIPCALIDEIAFFRSEHSLNPDYEILEAIRPGMATIPNAMLLGASSPYARRGELYKTYRKFFGKDDDRVLVWQADTRAMNPTVPQHVIDAAYERDPIAASAEYGAKFRTDVETFVKEEALEACVIPGRYELPPMAEHNYVGFVDPSGGSQDSMTLAIAHAEGDRGILDLTREEKPPFSPEAVVTSFCEILKSYRVHDVTGDRYGGEWPRERFKVHGVIYQTCDKIKSDIYHAVLPMINSQQVELLDDEKMFVQTMGLERRTARGGRPSIDHGPGGRDDIINAAAGALVRITSSRPVEVW